MQVPGVLGHDSEAVESQGDESIRLMSKPSATWYLAWDGVPRMHARHFGQTMRRPMMHATSTKTHSMTTASAIDENQAATR